MCKFSLGFPYLFHWYLEKKLLYAETTSKLSQKHENDPYFFKCRGNQLRIFIDHAYQV